MTDETNRPVVELVPSKTDKEIADDLKKRFADAMKPAMAIMDEALANRMMIRFQTITPAPPYMRHEVIGLTVVREF